MLFINITIVISLLLYYKDGCLIILNKICDIANWYNYIYENSSYNKNK